MHKFAMKIMECVKAKTEAKGFDNFDDAELCRLEKWVCIADKIADFDYHYHIVKAMEEHPEEKYGETYDENGRFYTPPRSSNGQFRQDMRKHGYEESYDMMPMYYRDMDMRDGRMYYTDPDMRGYSYESGGHSSIGNTSNSSGNMGNRGYGQSNNAGYSESGYERARRGFEEAKMKNPSTDNMDKIEEMFEELEEEIKELKPKMSQNEKQFSKNKLNNIANMMM